MYSEPVGEFLQPFGVKYVAQRTITIFFFHESFESCWACDADIILPRPEV